MAKDKYKDFQVVDVQREANPRVLELLAQVEREEQANGEQRVNIRWNRDQVNIVKRAAKLLDVPYQVYIKQLVIKQAVADIQSVESVLGAGKAK